MKKKQSFNFGAPKKRAEDNLSKSETDCLIDKRLGYSFFKDLETESKRSLKKLTKYYRQTKDQQLTESEKTALVWFLENFHYVEDSEVFLEESFNTRAAASLPIFNKNQKVRVVEITQDFLNNKKRFTQATLINHFKQVQKKYNLNLAELWFIPTALQLLILLKLEKRLTPIYEQRTGDKVSKIDYEIKYLITALIYTNKINWKKFVEETSVVEKILRKDPAKVYSEMDFKTRDAYRHLIEIIAKRSGKDEIEVASLALSMAKKSKDPKVCHIGSILAGPKKIELEKKLGYRPDMRERIRRQLNLTHGRYLIIVIFALGFTLAYYFASLLGKSSSIILVLLAWLVLLVVVETILNRILIKFFPPQSLYRLNYDLSVSDQSKTLVIIPTLLTENPADPEKLLENLELNYLANKDPNIFFGLMLSFQESKEKNDNPTNKQLKNLEKLKEGLASLNKKYPRKEDAFLVIFRKRIWSDCQEACIEWERKRGKIIELTRLLRGKKEVNFHLVTANNSTLQKIKYVITLDQGELLTKGAAKKLIATISHPLNRAELDKERNIVTAGYGIIQPTMLPNYNEGKSLFERMAGCHGWDSYSGLSSNVYQDIFSEGTFVGKGIFDVDIFLKVIDGRFLEDTILSHDLIEGFYCRTAHASDIQVFEDEPHNYVSYSQRKERWTRGDWQNIFWLLSSIKSEKGLKKESNPLFLHHRWRIFNNLARSLVFPLTAIILIYSWFYLDPREAYWITIGMLVFINIDSLLALIDIMPPRRSLLAWREYLRNLFGSLVSVLLDSAFKIFFLLHQAILIISAISRALYRVLISHKKTLEWQAFHLTKGNGKDSIKPILSFMGTSQVLALFLFTFYLLGEPQPLVVFILASWILAPVAAYGFSLKFSKNKAVIGETDLNRLRLIALKTWRFFDELVKFDTGYLPPDHYSEIGKGKISQMTSITNIGAYLLSAKAASDLGYISDNQFLNRLNQTLESLSELERHKGHFFNWYDVKNKKSLAPRYISTVDSGNFAVSLLTLKESVLELTSKNLADGFKDSFNDYVIMMIRTHDEVALSTEKIKKMGQKLESLQEINLKLSYENPAAAYLSYQELESQISSLGSIYLEKTSVKKDSGFWHWFKGSEEIIKERKTVLLSFYPWLGDNYFIGKGIDFFAELELGKSLLDLKNIISKKKEQLVNEDFSITLKKKINLYLDQSIAQITSYETSINRSLLLINKLIDEMDFEFLYDKDRELFRIGYNHDKKRYDKNYYDLYASEARLASFFALIKNDVTLDHWSELGRPLAHHKGRLLLLSWGGSIFEYFFPQMFLPARKNTLLDVALKSAFWAHLEYGKENSIPWGVSESSYMQKNRVNEYLYKMHGIPSLGMRRVQKKDLVAAPYSTFLAFEQNPSEAVANIKRLQHLGVEGRYGFYESIDFNQKSEGNVAKVYMAHHQGAIIISIVNYLKDRPFEKRFMQNPEVKSLAYLLEEMVIVRGKLKKIFDPKKQVKPQFKIKAKKTAEKTYLEAPLMHVLSNGRLRSFVSSRGSGFLEYGNISLIPFKKDPVIDTSGCHIYIKDNKKQTVWSAAFQPTLIEPESYQYISSENYFKIERLDFGIQSLLEVFIHPLVNAEVRAVTLTNKTQQRRSLSLCSYGEVSLFNHNEFWAHPNFQKLKIEATNPRLGEIYFKKLVSRSEHSPVFAHLAIADKQAQKNFKSYIRRPEFIGSGDLVLPDALDSESSFYNQPGFDSIFATKVNLHLMPLEKKTIYFVNLYAGKEERLKQSLSLIGDASNLSKTIDTVRPKNRQENNQSTNLQKIISLLFFRRPDPSYFADFKNETRNQFKVDWSKPTVTIELGQNFSKTFFNEAIYYLSQIVLKGVKVNIFILTHEKDEYSQKTATFVERSIGSIKNNGAPSDVRFSDYVTLVNVASITKETQQGLRSVGSLYWDASKRSLNNLIDNEFRKI